MTMHLTEPGTVPPTLDERPAVVAHRRHLPGLRAQLRRRRRRRHRRPRGVRSRLGYLKDLGVDAIWFNPWYPSRSPTAATTWRTTATSTRSFGTLDEAELLISEALALGIRTIIDVVPNHLCDQHPWFQAALAAGPGSARARALLVPPGQGRRTATRCPTHWVSSFQGDTWTRTTNPDGTPGEWYLHLFTPEQPDLNWNHPDVRARARGHPAVLVRPRRRRRAHRLRRPCSSRTRRCPRCRESRAAGEHPTEDRDELHDVYRAWRRDRRLLPGHARARRRDLGARHRAVRRLPPARRDAHRVQLRLPRAPVGRRGAFRDSIDLTLAAHAPVGAPSTWVLSNHDVTRPVTRYGREDSALRVPQASGSALPTDPELGRRRARAAALLIAALPGSALHLPGRRARPARGRGPAARAASRTRCTSARAASTRAATDAACRCPGAEREPPFGFSPAATADAPSRGCRSRAEWAALTVEAQEADPGSMLWPVPRRRSACASASCPPRRRRADLAGDASPDARSPSGAATTSSCVTNLGDRAHAAARARPHPALQHPARRRAAASRLHGLAAPTRLTVEAATRTTPRQSPSPHPHHTAPKGKDNEVTSIGSLLAGLAAFATVGALAACSRGRR